MAAGMEELRDLPGLDPACAISDAVSDMNDLAAHFSDWADRRMVAEMAKIDMGSLKIRQRIASGVRCRLEILEPHREAVRRCLTYLALPHHAGLSLKCTYNTVSDIWYATGDESADFSFYSKRAPLAPVLGSTVLYWLADEGDGQGDFPETWGFLDRRIADAMRIPKITGRLRQLPAGIPRPRRFVRRVRERLREGERG